MAISETARFAINPVLTAPSLFRATNRVIQNGNAGARNAK